MGFQDEKEIVWCLDARTGATLWKHAYAADLHAKYYEGGPGVTPTFTADAVFVLGGKQGKAFALHPKTGNTDLAARFESRSRLGTTRVAFCRIALLPR